MRSRWFVSSFLLAALLLAACQPAALEVQFPTRTPRASAGPVDLVLLHTNDTWGYTQPCG